MHRIDGPGATVDGKFTEGNPAAGVPATVVTAAWMTDVQEELISVLSTAGIAPVKGTQDQLLKAIRTIASGVVGQVRNLKMSVTAASASATLTADEVIVETALGGLRYCLPSFSKTINLATTGVGGMDTGTAPASGWVAVYAIFNPVTGVSGLLAVNATGINMPNIYAGGNMPAGFTASALLSVWATTAASLFVAAFQIDRKISFFQVQVLNTATQQASLTTIAITNAVPQNAKFASFLMSCTSTAIASITCVIAGSSSNIGQRNMSVAPSTGINLSAADVPLVAAQNVNYLATVTAGTMSLQIYVTDYTI